jgi:tRNA-dihydrouridine synthase 3
MGAALLKRPSTLARIIEAMVLALPVPVTVKIRSGWSDGKANASEVAQMAEEAGASAISIHPRSRSQRYSRAADWDLVTRLVGERSVPIIGNGDILTHFEAQRFSEQSGCASVMIGRGALIKPWIFQEIEQGKGWEPTALERIGIYHRLAMYMKEHFRDDAKGRDRTMRFLPWHLGFFWRYRPLPESEFGESSRTHPLIQTRRPQEDVTDPLERLLRDPREEVHQEIADALWDAVSHEAAVEACAGIRLEAPPTEDESGEFQTSCG